MCSLSAPGNEPAERLRRLIFQQQAVISKQSDGLRGRSRAMTMRLPASMHHDASEGLSDFEIQIDFITGSDPALF